MNILTLFGVITLMVVIYLIGFVTFCIKFPLVLLKKYDLGELNAAYIAVLLYLALTGVVITAIGVSL